MVSALLPSEIFLYSGGHGIGTSGACVMEWVSLLAGQEKTDRPRCTNLIVTVAAIEINDNLTDEQRQRLVPFIPRLLRAKATSADWRVNARLAIWQARRWLETWHGSEFERQRIEEEIKGTEDWLQGGNSNLMLDLLACVEDGEFVMASSRRPSDSLAFLSDLLDAHEKAMAEEGVLLEDELCLFAENHRDG